MDALVVPKVLCGRDHSICKECKGCNLANNPFMQGGWINPSLKDGAKTFLIIVDYPTFEDDTNASTLYGDSGWFFRNALEDAGYFKHNVYVTYGVKCSQGKRPIARIINACRGFLKSEIDELKPDGILTVGASAFQSLFKKQGMQSRRMTLLKYEGIPTFVTFNHGYIHREPNEAKRFQDDLRFCFDTVTGAKIVTHSVKVNINPSHKDCVAFMKRAVKDDHIVIDAETNSLTPYAKGDDFKMLCVGLTNSTKTIVLWFDAADSEITFERKMSIRQNRKFLQAILDRCKFIGHHVKYDMHVLNHVGFNVVPENFVGDSMIAHSIVFPIEGGHDLDTVTSDLLGVPKYKHMIEPYVGDGKDGERWERCPYDALANYCGHDTHYTRMNHKILIQNMKDERKGAPLKLYNSITIPAMWALYEAEVCGLQVDIKYREELQKDLQVEIDALLKEIRNMLVIDRYQKAKWKVLVNEQVKKKQAGKRVSTSAVMLRRREGTWFKPSSPKQVSEMLYGNVNSFSLSPEVGQKTPAGAISVGKEWLERVQQMCVNTGGERAVNLPVYKFCERVIKYNEFSTLQSTFVVGLGQFITSKNRVHPQFNIGRARTGRLSCSSPNFQNIPVRAGSMFRDMYITDRGHALVGLDYSQIELRVLAALANDEAMIKIFKDGGDIHDQTGRWVFGKLKGEELSANERRAAKAVNFGVVYGESAYGLARDIDITEDDAQRFIDTYFDRFDGVRRWQELTRRQVRRTGKVISMFGRRRSIQSATIKDTQANRKTLGNAMRMAVNTPVQMTAADFMLLSLAEFHRRKHAGEFVGVRLVNTIHDSGYFLIRTRLVNEEVPKLVNLMIEEPLKWLGKAMRGVPVKVDAEAGVRWGSLEHLSVDG